MRLSPDDFEIEKTEHLTKSSTVLMLDLSLSMPMRDNFLPAKKVAMALHSLITSQFPRDYMGIVGFSETARILTAAQLPEVSWDFVYGTNMQHGFLLARHLLAKQSGTKQIIMITDGEPTAHITQRGDVFFNYPPVPETIEATLREVVRCTKDNIRINTFMLDANSYLKSFIEKLTSINRGPRLLHHAGDTRRLRAGRLHRAQEVAGPRRRCPPRRLTQRPGRSQRLESAGPMRVPSYQTLAIWVGLAESISQVLMHEVHAALLHRRQHTVGVDAGIVRPLHPCRCRRLVGEPVDACRSRLRSSSCHRVPGRGVARPSSSSQRARST